MSFTTTEILRQPEAWGKAVAVARANASVLPEAAERVAVIGCGTSWFMAHAFAKLRESRGSGETDAFPASELPERRYDRLVAITRSGTTSEVIRALQNWRGRCPSVVITTSNDLPVCEYASAVVPLEFADEQSVVQTVFATTALAVLRSHLGDDVQAIATQASVALEESQDAQLVEAQQFSFLGSGWGYGIACEAALKLREASRTWTEAYPSMEYRHGPISIAEPGRVVWIFGERCARLEADARATGATVVAHGSDPQVDLIRAQRLAVMLAMKQGLDPDQPRNLARSVLLEP